MRALAHEGVVSNMASRRPRRSRGASALSSDAPSSSASFELVEEGSDSGTASIEDALAGLSFDSGSSSSMPVVQPTLANVRAHTHAQTQAQAEPSVRRQFVCPEHGAFWKKVPAAGNKRNGACVARCKKCPVVAGVGLKYVAIPVDEERGKGLYHCRECANTWTSNTACRKLAQYCFAEGCTARDHMIGELPSELRAPDPGWLRARRFARARARNPTIDEHAPFDAEAGLGGEGGTGGGMGGGVGGARQRRAHFCAGCATGACKQPPPLSPVHESTGSTAATMSGGTWSTANSEWSVGSVHTERSPATTSRSRRRQFLGGGRAADEAPTTPPP